MEEKNRTELQNRALHKFFEILAEEMNETGIDFRSVILELPKADISATKQNIKDMIWRPVQKALLLKKSTTQLTTKEIDVIYNHLNRFFAEHFKFQIPNFPSIESMMIEAGWYNSDLNK